MNKKFFFGSIAVLAIAVLTAFNVNMNTQDNRLSDVSLANVEALASEIGKKGCLTSIDYVNNRELCSTNPVMHTTLVGTSYSCSSTRNGGDSSCQTGFQGTSTNGCSGQTQTINSVATVGC